MLVPILEFEDKVQVKDQTRFDATKSFKTKDETTITVCELTVGADGSPIDIFDADQTQWFLDWAWPDAKFDIDAGLHKLYFKRISTGIEYTVTLTAGTYTFAALVAHIQTRLNLASGVVWALTLNDKDQIVVSTNESVEIQFNKDAQNNLWPHVGFKREYSGKDLTGEPIEYGLRKITLNIENADPVTATESFYQKVYTKKGDALFSNDADLKAHEENILDWAPAGRSSFLNVHRRSQEVILNWIYQAGKTDKDGNRFTKFDILDLEDVRLWSVFETLHFLFMNFQNSNEDVFKEKAGYYEKMMFAARAQALLKLDYNKDGKLNETEKIGENTTSGELFRK